MDQLTYGERYRKERYRKFAENLVNPNDAMLASDAAKHLARMFNSQTDPPDKIILIQFQAPIKPGLKDAQQPAPQPAIFYEDYVQPEDLK